MKAALVAVSFGAVLCAAGAWAELIELDTAQRIAAAVELGAARERAYWNDDDRPEKAALPPVMLPAGIEDAMRATVRIEAVYPDRPMLRLAAIGERMTWFRRAVAPTPPEPGETASAAAGFIIAPGFVMTAAHVVDDAPGSRVYRVTTAAGRTFDAAGIEFSSKYDAALVRVPELAGPVLPLATAAPAGAAIATIGMPVGMQWAVTPGDVESRAADRVKLRLVSRPGNSGGPVIDTEGRAVGILSFGNSGGTSWAMPAAAALADIQQHPAGLCLPAGGQTL